MKSIYNFIKQITLYRCIPRTKFQISISSLKTNSYQWVLPLIYDYFEMGARNHPQNQNINANFISNLKLIILEKKGFSERCISIILCEFKCYKKRLSNLGKKSQILPLELNLKRIFSTSYANISQKIIQSPWDLACNRKILALSTKSSRCLNDAKSALLATLYHLVIKTDF